MADKNSEIDGANPAMPQEQRIAVEIVVRDIAEQKERRKRNGGQHEPHVHNAFFPANVDVTQNKADRAERVEHSVSRWKAIGPCRGRYSALEIDQPDKKTEDEAAQRQNDRERLAGQTA